MLMLVWSTRTPHRKSYHPQLPYMEGWSNEDLTQSETMLISGKCLLMKMPLLIAGGLDEISFQGPFKMKLFCDSTVLGSCTNSTRFKRTHNYSFQHATPVPKYSADLWSSSPQVEHPRQNTQVCTEDREAGWSCEPIFNDVFQRANFYNSRKKHQWLKHLFVVKVSE